VDPEGPFGAKEAGEGSLAATIPAIANAIYDAVGVRITTLPITPEKVLEALAEKKKRERGKAGGNGAQQPVQGRPDAGGTKAGAR
jgi:4-hydroxybenzoyl-CoA reductase subunit alpha